MLGALWVMGCVYNVPPMRTKDRPWLDVLSEAINNPLRLLIGWYMVPSGLIAPAIAAGFLLDDWLLFHGLQTIQ